MFCYRYVLKELIETEKYYVADLGLIVEVNLTVCCLRNANTMWTVREERT